MMTGRELQLRGFTLAGEFVDTKRSNGLLKFRSQEPVPATRGIYAWIVDDKVMSDEVVYVGWTDNLHRRVVGEHIRQPRSGRARTELRRVLERGARVQVLIATPEPGQWNGLKVYTEIGLEAGLIELARPKWNMRGNAGVGRAVAASLNRRTDS